MYRLVITVAMLGCLIHVSLAQETDPRIERGEAIAKSMCAACHAIGKSDLGPRVGAPAFRTMEERFDLDSFIDRLRQGLTSGHLDMPTFRFTRDDARALIAYLRTIQRP